ncbi:MAG: tetratricopeptide repeat protein [Acidobacteria bacterium]|nr:tetratricopeptide repeat protein [Acidobacteriota bacterium]
MDIVPQNSIFAKISKSQQEFFIASIIILVTLITFTNTLLNGFVYDDISIVQNNSSINALSKIPNLFLQGYWGENNRNGLYRPITVVTYSLNYAINGLEPYGYHLVNIIIHIINSLLVYWIVKHYSESKLLSIFTALLFSVHPVHSEAVAAIYGRAELLAAMFLLIAWVYYLKSLTSKYYYIISLLSYFLSLFCKESGIVFFGILLLVQFCTKTSWKEKLIPEIKAWGYVLSTIPYLVIRVWITGAFGIPKAGQLLGAESFLTRLYTMSLGFVQYFKMLVYPVTLFIDYDYGVIPIVKALNLSVSLSLILILLVIIIGFWQSGKNPIIGFAILFFFITISIVSNVLIPTGFLIAERTIYIAVLSICLIIAAIFYQLYQLGWQKLALTGFIIVLSLLSIRAYFHNIDFRDNFTFFTTIVKLSPNNPRVNYSLGIHYLRNDDFLKSEEYLEKALKLIPDYSTAMAALGELYFEQGQIDKSIDILNKALALSPKLSYANQNMARIYKDKKDYEKAKEFLLEAIKNSSPNAKLEQELAMLLYEMGQEEQAIISFKKALELDPNFAEPLVNLARIARKKNDTTQATNLLAKALKLDPSNADANNLWGAGLLAKGDLCQAKTYLVKAVNLDNKLAEAHNNLGVTFAQMNLYTEARREFQLALQINPDYSSAKQNLSLLNEIGQAKTPVINCPE